MLLSWIVFLPLAGAVLALLVGGRDGRRDGVVRWMSLGVSLAVFALTVRLWTGYDARPGAAIGPGGSPA